MKKILFGLFALSTLAFGAIGDDHLYLRAEFTPFAKYNIDGDEGAVKDRISGASYGIEAEITREFMYGLEAGLGIGYQWQGDFDYAAGYDGEEHLPDFNSIPIYFTVKYSMIPMGNLVPYIKGDIGYSYNDLDDNKYFSYENGLYYGIAVGAEIENLSLEISYKVNEGKIKSEGEKSDIDSSRVMFGAAYKFNF